jgi:hypothetical protein
MERQGIELLLRGIEIGIANTVAALYEANVEDSDIINLLNKYWGYVKMRL